MSLNRLGLGSGVERGLLEELANFLCTETGLDLLAGYDFQILIFSDDDVKHATRLRLLHPVTRTELTFSCEPPADFLAAVEQAGLHYNGLPPG